MSHPRFRPGSGKRLIAAALALVVSTYGTMIQADGIRSGSMLGNTCAGCHGTDGVSAGDHMPNLAGLSRDYLINAMTDFKNGTRPSTIMGRIARGYSDQEIRTMAAFFSRLPGAGNSAWVDASLAKKGAAIHKERCESCHKKGGTYNDRGVPRLTGQWPEYIATLLRDLHDLENPTPQPIMMRERVQRLSGGDIKALAHYYASRR